MEKSLEAVFIFDEEQYRLFSDLCDKITSVVLIDELGKYPLGTRDCGYYAVEAEVISTFATEAELIRFLTTAFRFICLRIEGTTAVFTNMQTI